MNCATHYRVLKHHARPPQADMFEQELPPIKFGSAKGLTLQQAFDDFHRRNPHVYVALVRMARTVKAAGRERVGIGMLFEVLRWDYLVNTSHSVDDFKLNNNHRSRYARLIMEQERDLADFFETRGLRAA